MASTVKLDGFDLWPHMRIAQGEGLDPADADHIAPQFADAAAGEGDPLLSVHAGNREMIFPLTLTPAAGGYPDTTDGLSQLVRDLNRRCASAQTLEWAQEGASASTFFDVTFARLEIAYDYRLAQQRWLKASVHVWAKPYGHTGTYRSIGTAVASLGIPAMLAISPNAVDGDVAPDIQIDVLGPTSVAPASPGSYSLIGAAVLPTTALGFIRAASLAIGGPSVLLVGATGAAGSQAIRLPVRDKRNASAQLFLFNGTSPLTPLTAPGANRLVALARAQWSGTASGVTLTAGDDTAAIGPTSTLVNDTGWSIVDLGVHNQASSLVRQPVNIGAGLIGSATTATGMLEIAGLLVLPENSSVGVWTRPLGTGPIRFGPDGTVNLSTNDSLTASRRGVLPAPPPATGAKIMGFAYRATDTNHNGQAGFADVRIRERFTYVR